MDALHLDQRHQDAGPTALLELDPTSCFQFDIIVKDTQSGPQGPAGVYACYDKDAPGTDFWDKMVPLGVLCHGGNDPEATSPNQLMENSISPAAPAYAKMTLGWQGRLSGPNDGALNDAVLGSGSESRAEPAVIVVHELS